MGILSILVQWNCRIRMEIEMKRTRLMGRTLLVLALFAAVSLGLCGRLFYLQVVKGDEYRNYVLDNLIQKTVIKAQRGTIYDRNMLQLAANSTTYRIFISPYDIDKATEKGEKDYKDTEDAQVISNHLSKILKLDYETIYNKTQKKNRKDETIAKNVEKGIADQVRQFIEDYGYNKQIHLEQTTTRYYPYKSLAAQCIGVMGTDGGLFGLELQYNEQMSGTDGLYISAKNAMSENMPTRYESYIDAEDGLSVVTTLDVTIQGILENQLKETYYKSMAGNQVCGVVMDVNTGGVLAMGVYPTFDLNDPYTLVGEYAEKLANCEYEKGTKEYNEYFWEQVYSMWKNKTITDTYEPGSTFKIITAAMGMQENVIDEKGYNCTGELNVAGTTIHCHKTGGHGSHPFAYQLQQSCNPTMMMVAAKLGTDTFWRYFVDFGYTEKTGIDLPGEAAGINHAKDRFNAVELATSSFGQTFKTTVIQQITAISTVANGGHVIKPHIVKALVDSDGNEVVSFEDQTEKRQILNSSVCSELTKILAEGTISGVAKNAYIPGYSIAAKTGTSEKRDAEDETLRIGSTVAFGPTEDAKIAVLIIVDEPGCEKKSGGTVAAPYVGKVMEQTLSYLGEERHYSEEEMAQLVVTLPSFVYKNVDVAKQGLENLGVTVEIVGNGNKVLSQFPEGGSQMSKNYGKVLLYTYEEGSVEIPDYDYGEVEVPNVLGNTVTNAVAKLLAAGFNVNIQGNLNSQAGSVPIVDTQTGLGEKLPYGTVILINCTHPNVEDQGHIDNRNR
ncbi:MAG: PASTA domain-containing protein [Ruminococcaceae bacterium]|nr:PASTA domain-containing protein [Oscillospiraceae bacterium]